MPAFKSTHVEVYVFRRRRGRVEFLALRRAAGRTLPGVWQPVTGGVRRGERSLAAAVREVREETGLSPRRWWALESPTVFFDAIADTIEVLPLFATEIAPDDVVRLSSEHDQHAFLPAREAGARFLWESQRRGLDELRRAVLENVPLAEALAVTAPAPAPRRRAAPRGRKATPRPRA